MRLLVFGATGGTGRELVKQALDQGHEVTAFVRDPAKMEGVAHEHLNVVRGDVLDSESVGDAIPGHDAVFVCIGAGPSRSSIREDSTRVITAAMEQAGVKRLICQSSLGVGDSKTNLGFFTRYVIVGIFLRHAFADHERQEAVVRKSSLDWILARPPHLVDGPRTGVYRHGFTPTDRDIKGKVSRADVADFMLKQTADDTYVRQTPGISY